MTGLVALGVVVAVTGFTATSSFIASRKSRRHVETAQHTQPLRPQNPPRAPVAPQPPTLVESPVDTSTSHAAATEHADAGHTEVASAAPDPPRPAPARGAQPAGHTAPRRAIRSTTQPRSVSGIPLF